MMQTTLAHGRLILSLEGVWDQLESATVSLHRLQEQPSERQFVRSRLSACRNELRELILLHQRSAPAVEPSTAVIGALHEVVDLLDCMQGTPNDAWCEIVYEAQDAVIDMLHRVRAAHNASPFGLVAISS